MVRFSILIDGKFEQRYADSTGETTTVGKPRTLIPRNVIATASSGTLTSQKKHIEEIFPGKTSSTSGRSWPNIKRSKCTSNRS